MHRRLLFFTLAAGLVPLGATRPVLGQTQPYVYNGPIMARDSALGCFGQTVTDDDNLIRNTLRGLYNRSATVAVNVFCPLNRRNVTNYAAYANNTDAVGMRSASIFVRNNSTANPIKCQVYAFSSATGTAHVSAFVSATTVGYTTLAFSNPFGTGTLAGEGIANIGYFCQLPNDGPGNNLLIGAEAVFDAN